MVSSLASLSHFPCFLPCSFSICFPVAISSLIPYKLGLLQFTLPECSHPLSGFHDHLQAHDFHISMSSSHLSCNSELPMMCPQVAPATHMGIISKTSVSLASSCIPQPPSEAFSCVYFVHFSPSPPPSPEFMPHCSASSNMPHIICSWFSEQCLILLPLGLSACFTVPSHRANPRPQLLPPGSLFWPGGVRPPPTVSLSPCVNARNTTL